MKKKRCTSLRRSGWRIVRCVRMKRETGGYPHWNEHISSGKGGVVKWSVKQKYWGV